MFWLLTFKCDFTNTVMQYEKKLSSHNFCCRNAARILHLQRETETSKMGRGRCTAGKVCGLPLNRSIRLFMRGTIAESPVSSPRCCVSPLLFLKAKSFPSHTALDVIVTDSLLPLSPPPPPLSPSTVAPLSWSTEETVTAPALWEKCFGELRDERESGGTCVTTRLLFALCVRKRVSMYRLCMCLQQRSDRGRREKRGNTA